MEDSGAGSGPPLSGADAQDLAVQARLVALVEEWSAAIVANDVARMTAFVADERAIVSESGITDRDAFLGCVASGDLTRSAMRAISPSRVRVHQDNATVTARMTNTAHHGGRRLGADAWVTDVFVRHGGRRPRVLTHLTSAAPADPAPDA